MIYTSLSPQPKTTFRQMLGETVTDDLVQHFAEVDGDQVRIQGLNSVKLQMAFFQ